MVDLLEPLTPQGAFDLFKTVTLNTLREQLAKAKDDVKALAEGYLENIATESAHYTAALLRGDPEAENNLKHLEAQVKMLGAILLREETARFADTFEAVALVIGKVAFRLFMSI